MYHFDHELKTERGGKVQIDRAARYGYWEHPDGTEGGGLWFDAAEGDALELIDFDGAYELPPSVVACLRANGYEVDETFD